MIDKLTKKQEAQLVEFRNECLKIGLSTERIDRGKDKEHIDFLYKKYLGIDKSPYIWYVESPVQYNLILNVLNNLGANLWANLRDNLRENLGDNLRANLRANLWDNLRDNLGANLKDNLMDNLWDNLEENLKKNNLLFNNIFWSNLDIQWISFYMYPLLYLDIDYGDLKNDIMTLFNLIKNTGFLFFHKSICFVSERPIKIHKNNRGQLHKDLGPALSFSDGYCLWMLNGVEVGKDLVMTPGSDLDCNIVLKEKNVEVRRELVRKIGIERLINNLGATVIETSIDKKYELLNFDCIDGGYRPYLKMFNPSIKTWHVEGVDSDCKTIDQALGFRNSFIRKNEWSKNKYKYEHPLVLT